MTALQQDSRLVRTDDDWLHLPNRWDVPVDICAGADVPIEPGAVEEVLTVLETAGTLARLADATGGGEARIDRVALTPDLHKGAGIPIGTVLRTTGALIPQAVGNDVNCGMRLETTSLTVDQVRPRLDALEGRLRHLFFEGGRGSRCRGSSGRPCCATGCPACSAFRAIARAESGRSTGPRTGGRAGSTASGTRPRPPNRSATGSTARAAPATTASSAASVEAITSPSSSTSRRSTTGTPPTPGGSSSGRSS
ncbi:RtcB family protein [Actinomadura luteofluorescens]|uniref:RtcB family protein n=1 Tax=Actinomadura luteofluorescens TaxID=46163 RepID=UPI00363B90F3